MTLINKRRIGLYRSFQVISSSLTRYVSPEDIFTIISTRSVSFDPSRVISVMPFRGRMMPVVTDPSLWVTLISALLILPAPALPVKITEIFELIGFFWT